MRMPCIKRRFGPVNSGPWPENRSSFPSKRPKAGASMFHPSLSITGTRQRRYLETKSKAEGFVDQLNVRRENHGTAARLLTPSQEEQAASAFKLLDDAQVAVTLTEIVGQHLSRIRAARRASHSSRHLRHSWRARPAGPPTSWRWMHFERSPRRCIARSSATSHRPKLRKSSPAWDRRIAISVCANCAQSSTTD